MPSEPPSPPRSSLALCGALALAIQACAGGSSGQPDTADTVAASADAPDLPDLVDAETAQPVSPSLAFDFTQPGPFRVGHRTLPMSYLPPGSTELRSSTLHLWYPTADTSGPVVFYEGLFPDPEAIADAAPAAPLEPGGYPVHAYSHGHRGFAATSAFLMRRFASHGWVAVAPDHTGNTLADTLEPRPAAMYHWRSSDISAALSALAALPEGDPLRGLAATDRVLLSGHSFGAHTTWMSAGARFDPALIAAACEGDGELAPCTALDRQVFAAGVADPRVVAIVPMAGTIRRELVGPDGHTSVAVPILAMSGGEDPVGADLQYTSTAGLDLTWIELAGACHQSFALGGCSSLDDDEAFGLISAWALAFGRRHVLFDAGAATRALLEGETLLSDEVTFMGPIR